MGRSELKYIRLLRGQSSLHWDWDTAMRFSASWLAHLFHGQSEHLNYFKKSPKQEKKKTNPKEKPQGIKVSTEFMPELSHIPSFPWILEPFYLTVSCKTWILHRLLPAYPIVQLSWYFCCNKTARIGCENINEVWLLAAKRALPAWWQGRNHTDWVCIHFQTRNIYYF